MGVLFLVSDGAWSARARAFVLAAKGLRARGHVVAIACESQCPVQVRTAESDVPIVALEPAASAAGDTWQLRRVVQERGIDVVFVHSDEEQIVASTASRLGRGSGVAVIRRVPPFEVVNQGHAARFATRISPTGFLFSTEADRSAADVSRLAVPSGVATLGIDPAEHERVRAASKTSIGAPPDARVIVCVHDGGDKRRVYTALRTLALLAPRHPELHLAIVGTPRHDELRMHGAALGVNARVSFIGPTENELSIIRAADVGWIAADGDGAAFAALDFMACGTAVVAERSPLMEHYVADGIAGVLLTPAEPTTIAATVAAFLAKDEQRVAMGRAGRARLLRDFTPDNMTQGFEQAIAAAVGRRPQTVA
jgi:glycosyltransferase involved in cell wall biosynthesis